MIVVTHNRDSQRQIRRFLRKGGALDVGEHTHDLVSNLP